MSQAADVPGSELGDRPATYPTLLRGQLTGCPAVVSALLGAGPTLPGARTYRSPDVMTGWGYRVRVVRPAA